MRGRWPFRLLNSSTLRLFAIVAALLSGAALTAQAAASMHATGRYAVVTGDAGTPVQEVADLIDAAVPKAARLTGATDLRAIHALVYADRGRFAAATGARRDGPIVGLAVFPSQVIYLDGTGVFTSLRRVVPHEVGHIMEYRALGSAAGQLPLWVNEGVAEYIARPDRAYVETGVLLSLRQGGVVPVSKLEAAFRDADSAGLAYAESASLIEFLAARWGEGSIARLLAELRRGADFDAALTRVTGLSPGQFEQAWQDSLRRPWWLVVPDLNLVLWFVMVLLLLLAVFRRWRERQRRLAAPEPDDPVEAGEGVESDGGV